MFAVSRATLTGLDFFMDQPLKSINQIICSWSAGRFKIAFSKKYTSCFICISALVVFCDEQSYRKDIIRRNAMLSERSTQLRQLLLVHHLLSTTLKKCFKFWQLCKNESNDNVRAHRWPVGQGASREQYGRSCPWSLLGKSFRFLIHLQCHSAHEKNPV